MVNNRPGDELLIFHCLPRLLCTLLAELLLGPPETPTKRLRTMTWNAQKENMCLVMAMVLVVKQLDKPVHQIHWNGLRHLLNTTSCFQCLFWLLLFTNASRRCEPRSSLCQAAFSCQQLPWPAALLLRDFSFRNMSL